MRCAVLVPFVVMVGTASAARAPGHPGTSGDQKEAPKNFSGKDEECIASLTFIRVKK